MDEAGRGSRPGRPRLHSVAGARALHSVATALVLSLAGCANDPERLQSRPGGGSTATSAAGARPCEPDSPRRRNAASTRRSPGANRTFRDRVVPSEHRPGRRPGHDGITRALLSRRRCLSRRDRGVSVLRLGVRLRRPVRGGAGPGGRRRHQRGQLPSRHRRSLTPPATVAKRRGRASSSPPRRPRPRDSWTAHASPRDDGRRRPSLGDRGEQAGAEPAGPPAHRRHGARDSGPRPRPPKLAVDVPRRPARGQSRRSSATSSDASTS